MKRTSIKNRILFNSAIIIGFTIIMILIGFFEFNKSKDFADNISPLTQQMAELGRLKIHYESFENDLEEYFIIGGEIHETRIKNIFDNVFTTIESVKHGEYKLPLVEEIENKSHILNKLIARLFNNNILEYSNREQNELIITIYSEIKNIKLLQNSLSEQTLERLQYYIEAQQNSIKTAILEFFVLGFIILVLYIVLGHIFSIGISVPLLKLKNAASEIYKGNFNIKADIDSNDEIGDLANVFNKMISQIQKSMNDLKDSEKKYRTILENIQDVYYRTDMEGNVLLISPSGAKMFGYDNMEEAMKVNIIRDIYFNPEERDVLIEKLLENGSARNYEITLKRKDGTLLTGEANSHLIYNNVNEPIAVEGMLRDITSRKRSEAALKESETKHREMIANISDVISIMDSDGIIRYKSPNIKKWFGWLPEDLIDTDGWATVHPDDLERIQKEFYTLLDKENSVTTVEYRYKCKDGSYKLIELTAVNLTTDSIVNGVLMNYHDITERSLAQEAMKKSSIIIDSTTDAVISTDVSDNITFWNKGAEKIYGYQKEDILGKPISIIYKEEDLHIVDSLVSDLMEGKDIPPIELACIDKNQREVEILLSLTTIKDKDGNVAELVGIIKDITEFKNLEEQLRHAYKLESVGTLTGGIAHDFNNILGIIVGNTELALDDVPEWNPAHFNLKEIKDASLRAADIVRQLLSYSRKTAQKLKPIGLITVIKDSLKLLRSTIPTTIEIRTNITATDETILADPIQINQIIMNLCINASQEMEQTGGILEITVENVTIDEESLNGYPDLTKGDYVKVTVTDTGSGIDSEIIDRIFDPYFTTKEVGKGSGMGLAVVHGIVLGHNGSITVDSQLGKGTTFNILFPVVAEKPEAEAKSTEELPSGNEKILFVDDEISIVKMAEQMLKRLGYQVETKTDPIKALELFKSKPDQFDLVVTDMTMPQMNGSRLSEKLMEIRSDIPVIICSGHSPLIDEDRARDLGVTAFIMKPIVMRQMAKTVRKVLDEAKS